MNILLVFLNFKFFKNKNLKRESFILCFSNIFEYKIICLNQ